MPVHPPPTARQGWTGVGRAGTSCSRGSAEAMAAEVASPGPGHSLSLGRLLPAGSGGEVVGDLAASPLGVAPESFPGNVGYLCSARRGLSYWKGRGRDKGRERRICPRSGRLRRQEPLPVFQDLRLIPRPLRDHSIQARKWLQEREKLAQSHTHSEMGTQPSPTRGLTATESKQQGDAFAILLRGSKR